MSARNFDNVPPHPSNTVTISTTPHQMRLAGGQLRTVAMPLRPQPVPIRKVQHDVTVSTSTPSSNSGSNNMSNSSSTTFTNQIKSEDLDNIEFHGASTSAATTTTSTSASGNMNMFQQYQRGNSTPTTSNGAASTAAAATGSAAAATLAMDQPAPVNLASKVAEVFLTAGHAFQKLGDLTLQLHTATDAEESKWSDKEVDGLRDALTRFAHELDQISTCVASRTTKHIKTDIKRRHLLEEANQQAKRMALSNASIAGPSSSYVSNANMHTIPLGQKRVSIQPTGKMIANRIPTRYPINSPSPSNMNGSTSGMPMLQQQQQVPQNMSGNTLMAQGYQKQPVSAIMPTWKRN